MAWAYLSQEDRDRRRIVKRFDHLERHRVYQAIPHGNLPVAMNVRVSAKWRPGVRSRSKLQQAIFEGLSFEVPHDVSLLERRKVRRPSDSGKLTFELFDVAFHFRPAVRLCKQLDHL